MVQLQLTPPSFPLLIYRCDSHRNSSTQRESFKATSTPTSAGDEDVSDFSVRAPLELPISPIPAWAKKLRNNFLARKKEKEKEKEKKSSTRPGSGSTSSILRLSKKFSSDFSWTSKRKSRKKSKTVKEMEMNISSTSLSRPPRPSSVPRYMRPSIRRHPLDDVSIGHNQQSVYPYHQPSMQELLETLYVQLVREVIRNGFIYDLCFDDDSCSFPNSKPRYPLKKEKKKKKPPLSPETITKENVDRYFPKLKDKINSLMTCEAHKSMGYPLLGFPACALDLTFA